MIFCPQDIKRFTDINIVETYPDFQKLTEYPIGSFVQNENFYWKNAVQIMDTNVVEPKDALTKWVKIRPSNRYAWIDLSSTTTTTNQNNISGDPTEGIVAIFESEFYNVMAFGNVLADEIKIEFSLDDFVTIDETIIWDYPSYLTPDSQTNKWYYRYGERREADMPYNKFFPISPRLGKIRVTIKPSSVDAGLASVGYMLCGMSQYVGQTQDTCKISFKDYSVYETDDFGTQVITKRGIQQIMDITTYSDNTLIMDYTKIVKKLLGKYVLAVGDENDDSIFENLLMLCVIKKFDTNLKSYKFKNISNFRLEETI